MTQRPSHYERSKKLFEESFGVDLQTVGIHSERQFDIVVPETEFSPAEVVMHFHEEFDLDFV